MHTCLIPSPIQESWILIDNSWQNYTVQLHNTILLIFHKDLSGAVQCERKAAQMRVRCKYLFRFESRWYPGILLQGTAWVIVWGWVPLEVVHQLGDRLLHLYRHGCHCMLLTTTLTVHTDLPIMDKHKTKSVCQTSVIGRLHLYVNVQWNKSLRNKNSSYLSF